VSYPAARAGIGPEIEILFMPITRIDCGWRLSEEVSV
jgi:hypothetical protein